MPEANEDRERQVVPRWRSFVSAARYGELRPLEEPSARKFSKRHLGPLLEDWKREPGLSVAADVVSAAVAIGAADAAKEQAEFVLSSDGATPAALTMAEQCLEGPGWRAGSSIVLAHEVPGDSGLHAAVNATRARLRFYPRNPVLWVHLSLLFTTLGQKPQAEHAMKVAMALAPTSRFVIRAASRMFLHHEEIERAHDILLRAASLQRDPWLLAGEIALASVRKRGSRLAKKARKLLASQRYSPFHLSELSGALATIEAQHGSMKKARALSRQSLECPAENAIAQVAWLDRQMGGFSWNELPADSLKSSEANAWAASRKGKWREALEEALNWKRDQPFSSRPATLAGYIASTVMEDFQTAAAILRHGLLGNPNDPVLNNNLAFALAKQNFVDEATSILERHRWSDVTEREYVCLTATKGLVAFRKGNPIKGRLLYQRAITTARAKNLTGLSQIAMVYFAIEELRLGRDGLSSLSREASEAIDELDQPLHGVFREKLQRAVNQAQE